MSAPWFWIGGATAAMTAYAVTRPVTTAIGTPVPSQVRPAGVATVAALGLAGGLLVWTVAHGHVGEGLATALAVAGVVAAQFGAQAVGVNIAVRERT